MQSIHPSPFLHSLISLEYLSIYIHILTSCTPPPKYLKDWLADPYNMPANMPAPCRTPPPSRLRAI